MKPPALTLVRMQRLFRSAARRGAAGYLARQDAEDDLDRQARAIQAQLDRAAREIDSSATDFVSAVAGVDRRRFVAASRISFWRELNVQLIRSVEQDSVDALVELFQTNPLGPTQAQIHATVDVSERHAKFWARDQALKLNSYVVQERALSVGIRRYGWVALDDGKTRPIHFALHGQVFDLSGPGPITNLQGDHNHPGMDYECRCGMDLTVESAFQDFDTQ